MAKSGKGHAAGSGADKGAAKDRARLERRLQKALDVEAKRRKQVAKAVADVKDLRGRLAALDGVPKAAAARGTAAAEATSEPKRAVAPAVLVNVSWTCCDN